MHTGVMTAMSLEIPDCSFLRHGREIEWLEPASLVQQETRAAYDLWTRIKGDRCWPARDDLKMRQMAPLVPYLALVKVLDDGADFEHRIVGDAMVCAFSVLIQNRRFSEIAKEAPALIEGSLTLFRKVLKCRAPIAWQQRVLDDSVHIRSTYSEMVLLPLGATPAAIDHIAAFGVQDRQS